MKKIAVFATLIPWLILAVSVLAGGHWAETFGIDWLALSPVWFAGGLVVAYRHGQWSKL